MRVSLVISTLTCGGAERVMTLLANEWARRGNTVQLVTLDREPPFFGLDGRVELVQLGCERPSATKFHALWNLYRSVAFLGRAFRGFRPDAIVGFTTRVNVKALMAAPRGVPVLVSERTNPSANVLPAFWERLTRRWYPRARALIVQTKRVADFYLSRGLSRVVVIANPVEALPDAVHKESSGDLLWLAVARLHWEKGIDLLLKAWAQSEQRRTSRLRILGDGPERAELEALSAALGVGDRVEFAGFVTDKLPHWKQASAFVLSSRHEGFPNALCEGMAAGLACVSFDCQSGPAELIQDGKNGLLVPPEDIAGLASAMDRVAADRELRERLGREAVKISVTLGVSGIVDRWEAALLP